ncbi:type I-D CRISPR-associated protein Cas7/Csc2 [Thermodesulfitimonas autotrophica]|uniref:type I-D CRISPR-associated protein Cas7/Csc2 n=1 Tax=Thermodesulfitimonas autotrophica TaxID=1894989 RepID=UPI002FDF8CBB
MARGSRSGQTVSNKAQAPSAEVKKLPETTLTGVNASNTKTVLVSAILEVTGQVRFGDGTDVGLTVTETDMVISPDGNQVQKLIWAGSKRRGVDRRTIHELRDQHWNGGPCYIGGDPQTERGGLCGRCPICWLYGFTGTTQGQNINAKSRVLYASSVSVEEVQEGLNVHSRNQVDEKTQTTAGAAGIHEEQVIVAGVHFPTYTALIHVLDWEIGAFAHALLENVNSNRYTAASRAQGGMKFAEHDGKLLVIVDESEQGVFPLTAPKIAGWETDWQKARKVFQDAMDVQALKETLKAQGFTVRDAAEQPDAQPQPQSNTFQPKSPEQATQPSNELVLEESDGIITVKQGEHVLMRRYTGMKGLGYLRQKQLAAKQHFMSLQADEFRKEINIYIAAISPKQKGVATSAEADEDTGSGDDDSATE